MKSFFSRLLTLSLLCAMLTGAVSLSTAQAQIPDQDNLQPITPGLVPEQNPPLPPHFSAADFEIQADGTVYVDDLIFDDLEAYLQSDYFSDENKRCGTPALSTIETARLAAGDCSLFQTNIKSEYNPSAVMIIPIVFHVIYNTDIAQTGNIPDQRIFDQVQVLNEDFRAMAGTLGAPGSDVKIQFELAGITRTQNADWFNDNNELTYKAALGWNQDHYLNIYTNTASGYLGYAYFPQESAGSVEDGVVVLYESVGGRDNGFDIYDQGRTLTHEIGHYLGLFHTFEGFGCYTGYTAGDLINDTNSEDTDHYSCVQTATCGTADPIANYMNYTPDDCMNNFTPEQANRITCSIKNYRPDLYHFDTLTLNLKVFLPMLTR